MTSDEESLANKLPTRLARECSADFMGFWRRVVADENRCRGVYLTLVEALTPSSVEISPERVAWALDTFATFGEVRRLFRLKRHLFEICASADDPRAALEIVRRHGRVVSRLCPDAARRFVTLSPSHIKETAAVPEDSRGEYVALSKYGRSRYRSMRRASDRRDFLRRASARRAGGKHLSVRPGVLPRYPMSDHDAEMVGRLTAMEIDRFTDAMANGSFTSNAPLTAAEARIAPRNLSEYLALSPLERWIAASPCM